MSDLGDYLKDQAEQGRLHSQGVFTVDLARAKLKLFRCQLPDPAMFILQLVQAVVRSGCLEIRFHESLGGLLAGPAGMEMFCRFETDEAFPLEVLRKEILGDPVKMSDTPIRDLVSGLGAALSLGDGVGVGYRGENGWTLLEHSRLKSRSQGKGYVFLFDLFFRDLRASRLVHERCYLSPVPIYWNNSLIANRSPLWKSQQRLMERLRPGQGLGICLQARSRVHWPLQKPPLSPPTSLYCRHVIEGDKIRIPGSRSVGAMVACAAAVSIPLEMEGETELIFVRHGVTLEPTMSVLDDFGCQVYLNGEDQALDLTRLRIREGATLEKGRMVARQELIDAARAALSEIPVGLSDWGPPVAHEPQLSPGARVGCGIMGVLALFTVPALGLPMLLGAATGGVTSAQKTDPKLSLEGKWIRDTRSRLLALAAVEPFPAPPAPPPPPLPSTRVKKPFLKRPPPKP